MGGCGRKMDGYTYPHSEQAGLGAELSGFWHTRPPIPPPVERDCYAGGRWQGLAVGCVFAAARPSTHGPFGTPLSGCTSREAPNQLSGTHAPNVLFFCSAPSTIQGRAGRRTSIHLELAGGPCFPPPSIVATAQSSLSPYFPPRPLLPSSPLPRSLARRVSSSQSLARRHPPVLCLPWRIDGQRQSHPWFCPRSRRCPISPGRASDAPAPPSARRLGPSPKVLPSIVP